MVFFAFGWFNLWTVVGLLAIVLAVLLLGKYLWVMGLMIPATVPLGVVATLLVGRAYEYEITAVELTIVVVAVSTMFALLWGIVEESDHSRLELLFIAYLVLASLSVLWIEDSAKYLVAVRVALYQVLSFFIAKMFIASDRARAWLFRLLPVVLAALSIQLLLVLAHLGSINKILLERSIVRTPVGAIAFVVAIIVLLLPLIVVQYYRSQGLSRLLAYLACVLGVLAVVFSIGKAAILVMLVSIAYLFIRMRKWKIFWQRGVIIAVAVALFLSGGLSAPSLLIERFSNITGDISSRFRVEEARTAFGVFLEHPIVGVGAGNLKYYFQRRLNGYSGESNVIIMQVAAEYGIVGLALLLAIVLAIRRAICNLQSAICNRNGRLLVMGFQASLLAAVLHGFLEVTFIGLAYGVLFWFLVGVMDGWRSTDH